MAADILLVPHNHFDPTWRRCFGKSAEAHGVVVRSYAAIEELCINALLRLAKQGYTFSEGQAAVWRKYLERNPRKWGAVRKQLAAGRLEVNLAGEVVPDSNLPTAEGLVRNFLVAMPLYRKLVGKDHPGLRLAWLEDAFGNSPNYPQVLLGVGAEVACQTSYRFCPEDVWVGIDGSRILCYDGHPAVRPGAFDKQPPCPKCRGRGCPACRDTGLQLVPGFNQEVVWKALEEAAGQTGRWVGVFLLTEEVVPDPALLELVARFNREHKGRACVRFANPSDLYQEYRPVMEAAGARRDDTPTVDLNPAMPGCMVSRIRCKQRTRSVAYGLLAAEACAADAAWVRGVPERLPDAFRTAWQQVAFNQFHDAITGTHIDAAYRELMEMLDQAEAVVRRYVPKTKARPLAPFARPRSGAGRKRLGNLDVTYDLRGIVSVLCDGHDVFGVCPGFGRLRRPLRVGELVLEADFGDAWGQRIAPFPDIRSDVSRIPLGDFHQSVEVSASAIRWKGKYRGGDPKVKRLQWTVTASASDDGRRIDFVTEVDWDTASRRLRVIVPVQSQEPTATYEVPFGFIDRTFDQAKLDYGQWRSNTMEWPTLHWVRKAVDSSCGVAVLNKGLPCNRWMPGRFDLSLLRSPEWSFCVVEPGNYEFWDIDGQKDAGKHRFEYSIWPYVDGIGEGELTRMGYRYNLPRPITPPFDVAGDVVVTAWKLAEAGDAWVLRLQEAGGRGTEVRITFDAPRSVTKANLLEEPQGEPTVTAEYETPLHKHGILTLIIR